MSSPQTQNLVTQLRTKTVSLYSQILKYQIHLVHQYSRAGFFRFLRDLIVADDWKGMLGTLRGTEESIKQDLQRLDSDALRNVDLKVSRLRGKVDDILTRLNEVRSLVKV
jgi:hypothetical protein